MQLMSSACVVSVLIQALFRSEENNQNWFIERCCRRRDNAATTERRLLYEERVTIWHGLKFAVEGPDASFRAATLKTLGNVNDIGDDEESPNYERIHADHSSVDQAMVAYNFISALQSGSSSSAGFSTNIDTLYNAIGAGRQELHRMMQMKAQKVQNQTLEVKPGHNTSSILKRING